MYKKKDRIINSVENLSNYVEGNDVYNSTLFYFLADPTIEREPYQVTVYEYRPDLIAEDFYGSTEYMGILLVQLGLSLSDLKKGTTIFLIPKAIVDSIIDQM